MADRIIDRIEAHARTRRMSRSMTIRISEEMHQRLAELAAAMSDKIPGRMTTVSDVARAVLEQALLKKGKDRELWGLEGRIPPDAK
jgi:predicted transcriptional regulator